MNRSLLLEDARIDNTDDDQACDDQGQRHECDEEDAASTGGEFAADYPILNPYSQSAYAHGVSKMPSDVHLVGMYIPGSQNTSSHQPVAPGLQSPEM